MKATRAHRQHGVRGPLGDTPLVLFDAKPEQPGVAAVYAATQAECVHVSKCIMWDHVGRFRRQSEKEVRQLQAGHRRGLGTGSWCSVITRPVMGMGYYGGHSMHYVSGKDQKHQCMHVLRARCSILACSCRGCYRCLDRALLRTHACMCTAAQMSPTGHKTHTMKSGTREQKWGCGVGCDSYTIGHCV